MVQILNCYLYAKKSYGTLSKGAIFFGRPCILRDFAKSSCMECTRQESQIYCSSQKLAALHFVNKIITALAGEKEEASKTFLIYLFGRGDKFLKKLKSITKIIRPNMTKVDCLPKNA